VPLQLVSSGSDLLIQNTGNSGFAISGNNLFDAFSGLNGQTTLDLYNLANPSAAPTVIGTDTGYFIAGIQVFDGNLFIDETDGDSVTNMIELSPVPEPAAPWLLIAGAAVAAVFYRKGRHRHARVL